MTHLKCYDSITPLEYAVSRSYIAAANLIRARDKDFTAHAIFHIFNKLFPREVCSIMSASLNVETAAAISIANKDAYKNIIGYIPNKTLFSCFFRTQPNKELDKDTDIKEKVNGLVT